MVVFAADVTGCSFVRLLLSLYKVILQTIVALSTKRNKYHSIAFRKKAILVLSANVTGCSFVGLLLSFYTVILHNIVAVAIRKK